MKQSRKTFIETLEALAARAKELYLQRQFGTAKVLSSDGVAPDDIQTFTEPTLFHQIEAFLNFSAVGSSKITPNTFCTQWIAQILIDLNKLLQA